MTKISFINSSDRIYNIERSLSLLKTEAVNGLKKALRVVVKISCTKNDPSFTVNTETLDAVLSFIRPHVRGQITLAAGAAGMGTFDVFKENGYLSLQDQYDLALADLNEESGDEDRLYRTLIDSDYLVSIANPKEESGLLFSGVIENIFHEKRQGSRRGFLRYFDQSAEDISQERIVEIFRSLRPGLGIIDGYQSLLLQGKTHTMAPTHFALAGFNLPVLDAFAAKLMGVNLTQENYISMLNGTKDQDVFISGDEWPKKPV